MTTDGDPLECIRISNDAERLATVMARAGESPEVVLEATYGWYWAVDALREQGAQVHLAHPSNGREPPPVSTTCGSPTRSEAPLLHRIRGHTRKRACCAPPGVIDRRRRSR